MMIYKILKLATEFNNSVLSDANTLALDEELLIPTAGDEDDLKILIKRCLKSQNTDNFKKNMIELDKFVHKFKHENFSPELLDFALSEDIWNWVNDLYRNDNSSKLITILKNEMSFLVNMDLFIL